MDRSIGRRTRALTAHRCPANSTLSVSTNKLTVNSCRSARLGTAPMVNIAHWALQQLSSARRFDQTVIKPASQPPASTAKPPSITLRIYLE
jgi:hypothetical protein